jgi:hypothetical protein
MIGLAPAFYGSSATQKLVSRRTDGSLSRDCGDAALDYRPRHLPWIVLQAPMNGCRRDGAFPRRDTDLILGSSQRPR